MFEVGQVLICINEKVLPKNDIGPPLVFNQEYTVKEIVLDKEGNQHLDIGIVSKISSVSSYETGEILPRGNKIHWCHPSRFKLK